MLDTKRIGVEINEEDITLGTDELKENSAPGPDGIPVTFLEKTKELTAKPMMMLQRQNLKDSRIAEVHKMFCFTNTQTLCQNNIDMYSERLLE